MVTRQWYLEKISLLNEIPGRNGRTFACDRGGMSAVEVAGGPVGSRLLTMAGPTCMEDMHGGERGWSLTTMQGGVGDERGGDGGRPASDAGEP